MANFVTRFGKGAPLSASDYDGNLAITSKKEEVGRGATRTVAANNADALTKAHADYVCDGVDDHLEIFSALDSIKSGSRGRVLLSSGTFTVDRIELDSTYSGIVIEGQGASTILVKKPQNYTSNSQVFLFRDDVSLIQNVLVCRLQIDGNKANVTGFPVAGIRLDGLPNHDITFRDIVIHDCSSNGFLAAGPVSVHGLRSYNNGGHGFATTSTERISYASDIKCWDNGGYGIDTWGWAQITGFSCWGNGTGGMKGGSNSKGMLLQGGHLHHNTGHGFTMTVPEGERAKISMDNMVAHNNTSNGFRFGSIADYYAGNIIAHDNALAGILFTNTARASVQNLYCSNNAVRNILCSETASVFIANYTSDGVTDYGIQSLNNPRVHIQSGNIDATSLATIALSAAQENLILENIVFPSNATITYNKNTSNGRSIISRCKFSGTNTFTISENVSMRDNEGYVTRNRGIASITGANTSTAVTHGLNRTPTAANIQVTPTTNLIAATKFWISNVGASTFQINVNTAPGGSNSDSFSWIASTE